MNLAPFLLSNIDVEILNSIQKTYNINDVNSIEYKCCCWVGIAPECPAGMTYGILTPFPKEKNEILGSEKMEKEEPKKENSRNDNPED